jgi:hypothetical protein
VPPKTLATCVLWVSPCICNCDASVCSNMAVCAAICRHMLSADTDCREVACHGMCRYLSATGYLHANIKPFFVALPKVQRHCRCRPGKTHLKPSHQSGVAHFEQG